MSHHFHPSIIRAYDMRGIVDETITEQDFFWFGRAFATYVAEQCATLKPRILVLRDGRVHSQRLARALMQGLKMCGAQVQNAGLGPTPMGYFAAFHHGVDAVMVVTGSHNPASHNGCKFMLRERSVYGEELTHIAARASTYAFLNGQGTETEIHLAPDYLRTILATAGAALHARPLAIAWDAGNGAAGPLVERLSAALPLHTHHTLYTEIDGTFPNHHPDPSQARNLVALQHTLRENECDFGLAFDGDGDRLGVIDDLGRMVSSDHLLMLYTADVLTHKPGATILVDVKTSDTVCDFIAQHGGVPLLWKTGHAHIKTKMREVGAQFGGEASGHLFFADRYYGYDDALYAALRMIALVAQGHLPLSARIDALPVIHSSEELRVPCADDQKFAAIAALQQNLVAAGMNVNTLDGVRVSTPDGWWLLRASNTEPVLIGRAGGDSQEAAQGALQQLQQAVDSCVSL
jgi:phosphomannomutase